MGAHMDRTTTREDTQNVLQGQCALEVCMVFQLLCMIFHLGSHCNALGKYTSSSMHCAFNMLFLEWYSTALRDAIYKGGVFQIPSTFVCGWVVMGVEKRRAGGDHI